MRKELCFRFAMVIRVVIVVGILCALYELYFANSRIVLRLGTKENRFVIK